MNFSRITTAAPSFEEHVALWSCTDWPPVSVGAFAKLCRGTDAFACARHGPDLIGMARLVTDGALYGYIQDVVVLPPLRNQGIGRSLIEHLMRRATELELRFVGLFSTPAAYSFYTRQGFSQLKEINIGLGVYLRN